MSNEQDQKTDWQKRELGALWKKESPNQKYLTGHIKDEGGNLQKVIIFSNKNKTKDNQPDFRVYKSEDRAKTEQSEVAAESEDDTLL